MTHDKKQSQDTSKTIPLQVNSSSTVFFGIGCKRVLTFISVFFVCGGPDLNWPAASGQAIEQAVPVVRSTGRGEVQSVDPHGHAHYESHPHPTTHDATRFITNRHSAVDLPLPEEKDAFTFAVFGDRTGGPPEGIEILKAAVADSNLFEPDLVMTVGDLIEGYNNTAAWIPQMREYKSVMHELLCPWFPVAGNHDIYWRGENRPNFHHEKDYEMHFGPLWYAFEHKNCWFIVLFSDEGNRVDGRKSFEDPQLQKISPEQFGWLRETLAKAKGADHVFAFLHHPRWLGGGYGGDWEKVHRAMVSAGNVRIVFAGHIHRMRYDGPRDGIEYVTLATVGGGQSGLAERAGFLHHYHLLTVRKNQIAMACLPVGEVMDVRKITGEISEDVQLLARTTPVYRSRPGIEQDGQPSDPLVLELFNPASLPVDFEVQIQSADHLWLISPDHLHRKLYAGQRVTEPIVLRRLSDTIDDAYSPPELVIRADYLAPAARIAIQEKRMAVPVKIDLPPPARPDHEMGVMVDAGNYLVVDNAGLQVPDGPLTLECWCKARAFSERVGLVTKTEQSEFGLFVGGGEPHFTIFLGDRYVEPHASGPLMKLGVWYHLAGVYDGEEVRLYLDGKLIASVPGHGRRRQNGLPLVIGGDLDSGGGSSSPFSGLIDGVRVSTVDRYQGESFTPARRVESDDSTALLINFDSFVGPLAYDESSNWAHARRIGYPELQQAD